MISFNLPDPTEQEKIRRGTHAYQAENGMHGRYVKATYIHQEYPKIMDKTPYPQLRDFKDKQDPEVLLEAARKRWDEKQMASVVRNKTEEEAYIEEHASDPVLTPGACPKTMDKTKAPSLASCNGLEDYREKRTAWREKVQSSIVYDEVEEQLWLEEHAETVAAQAPVPKRGKAKAA